MKQKVWYRNAICEYGKKVKIMEINNEVRDEINRVNTYRLYYVAMVAIMINLIHIIVFWLDGSLHTENELKWRTGIILSHMCLFVIMGILLFFNFLHKKKEMIKARIHLFPNIAIVIILLFGVSITVIDQLVTSNITPFLLACTIIAVVFLIRPFFATMIYTGAFVLYYNALEYTQLNKEMLLSNRVNGLTAVSIGVGLSIILWRSYLMNIKQRNHIEIQKLSLEQKNKQLSNLNIVKDTLFTVITHDIREPLATMVNIVDLIEEEINGLSNDSLEIIEEVRLQVCQSYSMIDNLLDWCNSQRGGLNYKPCACNLYNIVEETIFLARGKANAKKINILNKIKEELIVFVDRKMFDLVIRNILNNALKFTYTQGCITMEAYRSEEKIILAIRDDGVGMDLDKVRNVFNENKIHTTLGTEGEKGMGVGLKLCKEFIQINGGDIWVDSVVGKGSVFFVSIPYAVK